MPNRFASAPSASARRKSSCLRDETGELRAFHNTCRHRGSQLCQESEGRLKARLITCPYHAWSYSLRGDLVRVPSKSLPDGFDKANHPLYRVALSVWRGFVFVNLQEDAAGSAQASFDPASGDLGNWPLETLVSGHVLRKVMNCNWKIFWENFNECLHCPGVHKDLSRLVPIYGRGLMSRHDDPEWARHADNDAPEFSGGLRAGAETWSRDGQAHGPVFTGLTPAERAAGQTYATNLPSMFIVGHVDYVRTVRLVPLGPEQTELVAEWLFAPEALAGDRHRQHHRLRHPGAGGGRGNLRGQPEGPALDAPRGRRADARGIRSAPLPQLGARAARGAVCRRPCTSSDFGRYRHVTKPQTAASRPSVTNTEPSPKKASTTE